MTTVLYHPKPVYRKFMDGRYLLYASAETFAGAEKFVKMHGGKFKGLKVTPFPNHPGEYLVWEKV